MSFNYPLPRLSYPKRRELEEDLGHGRDRLELKDRMACPNCNSVRLNDYHHPLACAARGMEKWRKCISCGYVFRRDR